MKCYEIKQRGAVLRLFVYLTLIAVLLLPATGNYSPSRARSAGCPCCAGKRRGRGHNLHRHLHQLHRARFHYGGHGPGQCQPRSPTPSPSPRTCRSVSTNARKLVRYSRFFLQATDSVIFEGNGAELVGHIVWINSQGGNTDLSDGCPTSAQNLNYTLLTAITPGFIVVGKEGEDNSLITVTVRDLDMYELGSVAQIYKNASLILEDLNLERIISHEAGCKEPAIRAFEGANFTARNTVWNTIVNFAEVPAGAPAAFTWCDRRRRRGRGRRSHH